MFGKNVVHDQCGLGGGALPSTKYLVPSTRYLVPGTKYQVLGIRYLYQVLGTSYQVLGTKYQVLGLRFLNLDQYRTEDLRHDARAVRHGGRF